jgi:hypothetical protein
MPDENVITEQQQQVAEVKPEVLISQIEDGFWGDKPAVNGNGKEVQGEGAVQQQQQQQQQQAAPPVQFDEKTFVKDKWGYEDPELVKADLEELKVLREKVKTPEPIKYANEVSEQLHKAIEAGKIEDVHSILDKQIRISKLTTGEINKNVAGEIVKMNMQARYPTLTPVEIDYKFSKQFSVPVEPVYDEAKETEAEFTARHEQWEKTVKEVEMDLLIEAKTSLPELEKLKTELKLPQIQKPEAEVKQPTQEELDAAKKAADAFILNAESTLIGIKDTSVMYKDKDVEIQSAYVYSDEEKGIVREQVKAFAEYGLDANVILAPRWLNKDKTVNVARMQQDLLFLNSMDKIPQKLISDAVNKRMLEYIKGKKNIEITNGQRVESSNPVPTEQQLEDAYWDAAR